MEDNNSENLSNLQVNLDDNSVSPYFKNINENTSKENNQNKGNSNNGKSKDIMINMSNKQSQAVYAGDFEDKKPNDIRDNNELDDSVQYTTSGNYAEEISNSLLSNMNKKLNFIGKYFDVEIEDVSHKLVSSLIPFNKEFSNLVEQKPDLYGPFWIITTIIIWLAILGNFSRYLEYDSESNVKFAYQLDYVPVATAFFYLIGFGLPLVIYILMKFLFGMETKLITSICIYGYSFTILIPIFVLCVIPIEIVKIICLSYGFIVSSVFLVYNIYKEIEHKAGNSKYVILGLIILIQAIIYLTLKFYFFAQFNNEKASQSEINKLM